MYIGVKVTRNVAQYPLHHVTYLATKFEVATSNGLGDTFTRNVTDSRTDERTTDQQWCEINITFFLKKKGGIINQQWWCICNDYGYKLLNDSACISS